jgi:hypothetical protein
MRLLFRKRGTSDTISFPRDSPKSPVFERIAIFSVSAIMALRLPFNTWVKDTCRCILAIDLTRSIEILKAEY